MRLIQPFLVKTTFIISLVLLSISTIAQLSAVEKEQSYTQKIFPLIRYIQQHSKVIKILNEDKTFEQLLQKRSKNLSVHLVEKDLSAAMGAGLLWDSASIKSIGNSFVGIYARQKEIRDMVRDLKASHWYALSDQFADTNYLRSIWTQTAGSLNYIQKVYFLGQQTTYAKIDSISIRLDNPTIHSLLQDSLLKWVGHAEDSGFYSLSLKSALLALELNQRDEAIRYDPIKNGMNTKPVAGLKNTDFNQYIYSCILVPGLGPEIQGENLTEGGKQRCRMAVEQFKKGRAPFIMVSGGHVHPYKTPFCEAVEMKKFLIDSLAISDAVIFIEPYARHTTTNLRNANRLIRTFDMPFNKAVLIVTDSSQSAYINKSMKKTSMRDLGYLPYQKIKILSPTLTTYFPNIQSLQTDTQDPLDP